MPIVSIIHVTRILQQPPYKIEVCWHIVGHSAPPAATQPPSSTCSAWSAMSLVAQLFLLSPSSISSVSRTLTSRNNITSTATEPRHQTTAPPARPMSSTSPATQFQKLADDDHAAGDQQHQPAFREGAGGAGRNHPQSARGIRSDCSATPSSSIRSPPTTTAPSVSPADSASSH